jgi:beta-aspartyl-peptidase (threonine type)
VKRLFSLLSISLLAAGFLSCGGGDRKSQSRIALVIHGGAGTILREKMSPEHEAEIRGALEEALAAGYRILSRGGSSLDAVEAAVVVMEDSPLFNAGKGAVFTSRGTNEMDASIMDGSDLNAGAVASVMTIKNPVKAAREVMTNTRHVMLVGRGAELFAAGRGLEIVDPEYFFTKRRWDALLRVREKAQQGEEGKEKPGERHGSLRAPAAVEGDWKFGTSAACALDRDGNLAAATSTGGLTNKMHGRVGDTPIIGAGTYANNATCAVSATGTGEYFMRGLLSYQVSARMQFAGMTLEEAVKTVIDDELTGMGGDGGIIALDNGGRIEMRFNTAGMYRGYVKADGEYHVAIFGDE